MLPVRLRETGIRVPLGALTGEMGRESEALYESAEWEDRREYGCERARGRREAGGWVPEYTPAEDESAVRDDWMLGRGIALGLDWEFDDVDVPGLAA